MSDIYTQNEFFRELTRLIPELADLRVTSLSLELNTSKTKGDHPLWDRSLLITATFYAGKPESPIPLDEMNRPIEHTRQFRLVPIEEGMGET